MSKYTITIKTLMDNNFDFGLKDYPIFDEDYRDTLNRHILNFFYMDEIGFETAELFKFYLNNKMDLIMSYYNNLYRNLPVIEDTLTSNVNLTEEYKRVSDTTSENSSESHSENKGSGDSKNVIQNTPQGTLKNQNINNYTYASQITMNGTNSNSKIDDNSKNNGKINNVDEYIKKIQGSNGKKYGFEIFEGIKKNLINIDMMIIDELSDLFMGIM